MTSFNENSTKYAELAVKVRVNIQEGPFLLSIHIYYASITHLRLVKR
ncbi:hypothetical protein [Paenisporosarcina sp.]